MRLFITALPGAGASIFAFWLSQLKDSIGVIDTYVGETPLPNSTLYPIDLVNECDTIVKATISDYSFNKWKSEFKPHKTILYVRNPFQNYCSLKNKPYKDYGLEMETKFRIMDQIFLNKDNFDVIIRYEDFITKHQETVNQLVESGIPANIDFYRFDRKLSEIVINNFMKFPLLKAKFHKGWGTGNIHNGEELQNLTSLNYHEITDEVRIIVQKLCPNLVKFYEGYSEF